MFIRRLLPLLLLIVFSLTLMTYQSNKGILAPLRFLGTPLNHINETIHSLSEAIKGPFKKIALRDEENMKLRTEINRLLGEQQKYRELFFENRRLREVLSLKERERRYVATAKIISRGMDRRTDTIVIDKGRGDGVEKDMAVITPLGLVGKVLRADDRYAYVLLLTDMNFSAAVRLQETRREAILSGTGASRCILNYVPDEDAVKEGEAVVASGFDDLFPQEILIGYVSKVSKKSASIFKRVEVAPSQDLTKLDEVVIIKK